MTLKSGREWHSEAIRIGPGQVLDITCTANIGIYAGIFDVDTYVDARQRSAFRFPFIVGSARTAFHLVQPGDDRDYYLVLRNSGWALERARIRVRLVMT